MPNDSITAKFLRKIMNDLNITSQKELAAKLGINPWSISKYFSGKRQPALNYCLKIQEFLKSKGIHAELDEIRDRNR